LVRTRSRVRIPFWAPVPDYQRRSGFST